MGQCVSNPVSESNLLEDNYKVIEKLGQGSFGFVCSVKNVNNKKRAVKIVWITDLKVMRELLMLTPENRHKNIVKCHGAIIVAGNPPTGEWASLIEENPPSHIDRSFMMGSFIMAIELELCEGIMITLCYV